MANRAYLYSSDQCDDWDCPDDGYYDSRWSIPLAWWFFYGVYDVVRHEVHYGDSRWCEVKLSTVKDHALDRFASRRPLLLSLLGGGLGSGDIRRFESTVLGRPGHYLLMDPAEILGGLSDADDDGAQAVRFDRVLAALEGGTAAEFLEAVTPYIGELGTGSGGWQSQVFGYTYAADA